MKIVNFKVPGQTFDQMQKLREEKSINISHALRKFLENYISENLKKGVAA